MISALVAREWDEKIGRHQPRKTAHHRALEQETQQQRAARNQARRAQVLRPGDSFMTATQWMATFYGPRDVAWHFGGRYLPGYKFVDPDYLNGAYVYERDIVTQGDLEDWAELNPMPSIPGSEAERIVDPLHN